MTMLKILALTLSILPIANCLAADSQSNNLKFDLQRVWHPSRDNIWASACAYGGMEPQCRYVEMQKNGASPESIAFTKAWYERTKDVAYLSDFREMGRVDLAEITSPVYNDPNTSEYLLVNGSPSIVHLWEHIKHIDIRKDPNYKSLSKRFPKLEVWPMHGFDAMRNLSNGGQRFIVGFVLLNGCRACEVAGQAKFAYDFDKDGKFVRAKLLGLEGSKA